MIKDERICRWCGKPANYGPMSEQRFAEIEKWLRQETDNARDDTRRLDELSEALGPNSPLRGPAFVMLTYFDGTDADIRKAIDKFAEDWRVWTGSGNGA